MNRRDYILKAAAELFASRGFEATPTAEVAKVAGVSEGTIFHHFKTKDGVLLHIIREMMDCYLAELQSALAEAETGLEAIEWMIRSHFHFLSEHLRESVVIFRDMPAHFLKPDFPHRQLMVENIQQILKLSREAIERGQRDGSIRQVPVDKTALLIRGLLIGLTRQRLLAAVDIPDLCEEAVEFCRRSLKG